MPSRDKEVVHMNNSKISNSSYMNLPRSVYVIFFARLVNSIGNFVFPFMTLLLTTKIGMGEKQVGVYLLAISIIQIPGSLLGGKLTDLIGRKKIMVIFMGLAALCYIPCVFLIGSPSTIIYVPVFITLACLFHSLVGPASGAMLNDLTEPQNRQAAFSLLYMGMNAGTAIGSIVAGYLFKNYIKFMFLGDALTTLLSICLLAIYVKETKPNKEEINKLDVDNRSDEKEETGGLFAALIQRPRLLTFVAIDTIYAFVYAQTHFSMPLQSNSIFGEDLGAKYFGTFNMINCLEVIFLTTLLTILTRKIKPVYNVAIAGIFYAIGFGMLFFVNNFWLFVLSTIIWTIGEIINSINIGVYIANHTPITHRGRFSSIIDIITGSGRAIAPYIMGSYIENNGVTNVWPVIFVLALIASVMMLMLGKTEKKSVAILEN